MLVSSSQGCKIEIKHTESIEQVLAFNKWSLINVTFSNNYYLSIVKTLWLQVSTLFCTHPFILSARCTLDTICIKGDWKGQPFTSRTLVKRCRVRSRCEHWQLPTSQRERQPDMLCPLMGELSTYQEVVLSPNPDQTNKQTLIKPLHPTINL